MDNGSTDAPAPQVLAAWATLSRELLALTGEQGRLLWCNAAYRRRFGDRLPAGLDAGSVPEDGAWSVEIRVHDAVFEVRARHTADGIAWVFSDVTDERAHAAEAQHLRELLDSAQEFGRVGVWERDVRTGAGRWDRLVFDF